MDGGVGGVGERVCVDVPGHFKRYVEDLPRAILFSRRMWCYGLVSVRLFGPAEGCSEEVA